MSHAENKAGIILAPVEKDVVAKNMLDLTSNNVLGTIDRFRARNHISKVTRQQITEAASEVVRMHREAAVGEYADRMKLRGIEHYEWFQHNVRGVIERVQLALIEEDKRFLKLIVDTVQTVLEDEVVHLERANKSTLSEKRKAYMHDLIEESTDNALDQVRGRIETYMASYNSAFQNIFVQRFEVLQTTQT